MPELSRNEIFRSLQNVPSVKDAKAETSGERIRSACKKAVAVAMTTNGTPLSETKSMYEYHGCGISIMLAVENRKPMHVEIISTTLGRRKVLSADFDNGEVNTATAYYELPNSTNLWNSALNEVYNRKVESWEASQAEEKMAALLRMEASPGLLGMPPRFLDMDETGSNAKAKGPPKRASAHTQPRTKRKKGKTGRPAWKIAN